jgi:hypothetical protein
MYLPQEIVTEIKNFKIIKMGKNKHKNLPTDTNP